MAKLTEQDLTPVIHLRGSISASRDLSSLAHIAGALRGKPDISFNRGYSRKYRIKPADKVFALTGILPNYQLARHY